MGPVLYRALAVLRRTWPSALVLTVLLGLTGGVVLATAAGARRTASAHPRLLEDLDAGELLVSPNGGGTGTTGFFEALGGIDGVRGVGAQLGLSVIFHPDSPEGDIILAGAKGPLDADGFGSQVDRPKLFAGRLPADGALDEVLVNRAVADSGVGIGDLVDLALVGPGYFESYEFTGATETFRATVVGIGSTADEIIPYTDLSAEPWVTVSPAFTEQALEQAGPEAVQFEGASVDVEPGADLDDVLADIQQLAAEAFPTELPGGLFVSDQSEQAGTVQDGIRPVAVSLALFALVVGVVGAVVLGLLLRRHVEVSSGDRTALAGVGFSDRQHAQVTLLRGAVIGAGGAMLASLVALVASPRFPIGPARLVEPTPGVDVDVIVLLFGVIGVVLVGVVATLGGHGATAVRPVRRQLAYRISPAATAGLRAGLASGHRSSLMAVLAGLVGIASVVAVLQFGASLDRLVTEPTSYGQQWDRVLDGQFGAVPAATLLDRYRDDGRVTAMAGGTYGELAIDGDVVPSVGWLDLQGRTGPTVVDGRLAQQPGEVALGGALMDRFDLAVGDRFTADAGFGPRELEVVGEVVLARFNLGSFITTGLGDGAMLHVDDLFPVGLPREVLQEDLPSGFELDGRLFNFVAFDLVSNGTRVDEELAEISAGQFAYVRTDMRPTTIADLSRVRSVPAALAGVLALLAFGTLAHALTVSVRTRRRELAVLRTLGFDRRQLSATVRWQASAIALVAIVVGAPIGLAVGRSTWSAFAGGLHIPDLTTTPLLLIAAIGVGTVVVANLIALVPSRRAGAIRPASVLKAE